MPAIPSSAAGLTTSQAAARLAAEGPNRLPSVERRGTAAIALAVVREPMVLLLAVATAVYVVVGDVHEALILAASILSIVAITVVQEVLRRN
jgi:P-type Ca2+ transporter type 2C